MRVEKDFFVHFFLERWGLVIKFSLPTRDAGALSVHRMKF